MQYLKKEVSDANKHFLHADKHENLLQIDTMILTGIVRHSESSQNSKFTMSLQYLKKEARDEVDFVHVDKHQSFLQVDFNTLGMKDAYKVILSLLLGMSSILKVLKVIGLQISLQYLKKEDMKGVHFLHAAEHQSFYKLRLLFLMEVTRFYGGPAMFIVTCFFAQPDCENFLPEHCNTIIKPQLCGERFPLLLLQVDIFRENQGILQQSS